MIASTIETQDISELEAFYGDEEHFCITQEDGSCATFPDGTAWAICSNWACYVRRLEGPDAVIFGFAGEDNPTSEISRLADGHDFAVLDGRWIIDPWVKHVEALSDRCVFDLSDPADAPLITRIYGDQAAWTENDGLQAGVDRETPKQREIALAGIERHSLALPKP